jgi:hypothetical protein
MSEIKYQGKTTGRFSAAQTQKQSIPRDEISNLQAAIAQGAETPIPFVVENLSVENWPRSVAHWSSPNGCHEDCPACGAEEPNLIVGEYPPLSAEDLIPFKKGDT